MKVANKLRGLSRNDKIIVKNTAYAFIIKGGALAVSFLSAPAFISYFGGDKMVLGLWFTLLSVIIWFLNFDLGIGNGIRNHLVKALISNNRPEVRRILSSGLLSISVVTIFLTLFGIILLLNVDLNWLFNINENIVSRNTLLFSSITVLFAVMLTFMLTAIRSIFYSLQKSAVNNFLALCVSLLQLLFILCFHFSDTEVALKYVSVCYLVVTNLPYIIAGILIFGKELKDCRPSMKYVDWTTINKIMSIGSVFFICQIAYMIIANTNEFLVSKYFGTQYAAEYSFYYKLTFLISMMVSLALAPIWSLVTKALAEKDYAWLDKLYKRIKRLGLLLVVLQFAMIPFLQILMDIWLGKNFIIINYVVAIAFAFFGASFIYSGMLSTIVCGMARMKLQLYCYLIGIVVKILVIDFFAAQYYDWSIVIWSNVIVLTPYCILQQLDLNRFFKKVKIKDSIS